MRILALDHGTKRIGVAVRNELHNELRACFGACLMAGSTGN